MFINLFGSTEQSQIIKMEENNNLLLKTIDEESLNKAVQTFHKIETCRSVCIPVCNLVICIGLIYGLIYSFSKI